jgi:hypothetical protein
VLDIGAVSIVEILVSILDEVNKITMARGKPPVSPKTFLIGTVFADS